jgi:DNA topoisomerase I
MGNRHGRGPRATTIHANGAQAAKSVGLRYVSDDGPGIRRVKKGNGFRYVDPNGKMISDDEQLRRIKSLVIPPAWTGVWICPSPDGHLQATGRDARGRKQHRYHRRWRDVRDDAKFNRMALFARTLPKIRRRVEKDLRRSGLPREKVLATVVRLLEMSLIRVGNDEYAKNNNSFGLTTMRDRHVQVSRSKLRFRFRGKGGKEHAIDIEDRRLAGIVKRCQELPGQELFQYIDDNGERQDVGSADVNDYLREITGEDFTAKDFRTWAGTVIAAVALQEFKQFDSQTEAKKNIVRAIEHVSKRLGNTPAVCRKCYIHPAILDAYLNRTMLKTARQTAEKTLARGLRGLRPEEAAVLALFQQQLKKPSLETLLKRSIHKRQVRKSSAPA